MKNILVVDDEAGMRRTLELMLQKEGYAVASCAGLGELAIALTRQSPDVVITDLRLGSSSGLDVLRETRQRAPQAEVILMTAFGTIDTAVAAIKLGAFDYVTKPFRAEEMIGRVRRAVEKQALAAQGRSARTSRASAAALVAQSAAMRAVMAQVQRIAPTDLTVLITGETGTGKSLLARAIHAGSGAAARRLVAVNCV